MEENKIKDAIYKSIDELYQYDSLLLDANYNIHERTVCHRLAIYLEKNIGFEYNVDVEYNRMRTAYGVDDVGEIVGKAINYIDTDEGSSYVYTDIIIHKRDENINILIIEVKMFWKNRRKEIDYNKINQYINQLNYKFGVYIELHENKNDNLIDFWPFQKNANS